MRQAPRQLFQNQRMHLLNKTYEKALLEEHYSFKMYKKLRQMYKRALCPFQPFAAVYGRQTGAMTVMET